MRQDRTALGRRLFLVGLLTGAGVAGTVAAASRGAAARTETPPRLGRATGMVLYRRTQEAERYYRTLYA
jgi:hypothetical protein